jgi:hypothetical protein
MPDLSSMNVIANTCDTVHGAFFMLIDIATEQLFTLGEARRKLIPRNNGKEIAPSTIWRWTRKGCRTADGALVMLEVAWVGGRPMTSLQAVQRFTSELTNRNQVDSPSDISEQPKVRSPATETRLKEAGLL